MPRRNLLLLVSVAVIALICYQRVPRNRYGRVLGDAISKVEQGALEPVKAKVLFEDAMEGMLQGLDQYSVYIRPAELKQFHETIDQQFAGVGMEVGVDPHTKQLLVLCPLPNSPAQLAGIRPGDRILRIDGAGAQGMSLMDAVGLLRGPVGSPVTLTVLHEGEETPVEVKIVRAVIQKDTVLGDTRNPDGSWNFFLEGFDRIGYIRITSFAEQTIGELDRALDWLTEHEMRGLILDLRDDPGGFLGAAIEVCDRFISSGMIVTIRRRDGRVSQAYEASGEGPVIQTPMAVLVNGDTASAAEIVAACLQDHHRAVVVGQRSYGKGTVQEMVDLEEGCGAMKFTTASYWRPSGKDINRARNAQENGDWGVRPNEGFRVEMDNAQLQKQRQWRALRDLLKPNGKLKPVSRDTDPQLIRAVEYLQQQPVPAQK